MISSTTYVSNISHSRKNWERCDKKMSSALHVNTCYLCLIWMKLEYSWQIFEKYSNIKFHENLSSGSWVVPRGQTEGQTDITNLMVAFRNFANKPKNNSLHINYVIWEQDAVLQKNIDSNFSINTWKLLRSLPVKIWLHLRDICSRPK